MASEDIKLRCHTTQIKSFKKTAAAVRTKGDAWLESDLLVFALDDAATIGDEVAMCYGADKALFNKNTSVAMSIGDRIYWNFTNGNLDKTASGRALGWCVQAAGASDTTVVIDFTQELESSTY